MKQLFSIQLFLLIGCIAIAQSPQQFSYQALLRNSSNLVLADQSVSTRISILQGHISGIQVYTEIHQSNTNGNGLLTLFIGGGETTMDFNTIEWDQGPYFIKTETDITGGDDFSIVMTSQFLSVPYALHASTAVTASNGLQSGTSAGTMLFWNGFEWEELAAATQDGANLQFIDGAPVWVIGQSGPVEIGDLRHGGIVFWIDPDDSNSGLVCALEDAADLLNIDEAKTYAADYVNPSTGSGSFNDWRLPSIDELTNMYTNLHQNSLGEFNEAQNIPYWSSKQGSGNSYWYVRFGIYSVLYKSKNNNYRVRVVREF